MPIIPELIVPKPIKTSITPITKFLNINEKLVSTEDIWLIAIDFLCDPKGIKVKNELGMTNLIKFFSCFISPFI